MSEAHSSDVSRFKEAILQDWNENVAGMRKWHPQLAALCQAFTDNLLIAAGVEPGMHILDLASGTGEPALTLARAAGPDGRVTATDLVSDMLAVAEEN